MHALSQRRWLWLVALVAIVVAATSALFSFDSHPEFNDVDEPGALFDSPFLDLYLDGRWDDPAWHEFDRYANHPPLAAYLFGGVLHAIEEPISSLEPRRFWFRGDTLQTPEYRAGLHERLSSRQLLAGRMLAAAFAALAAVGLLAIGWRWYGAAGGIGLFLLALLHPLLRHLGNLSTVDSFLLFVLVGVLLCLDGMARSARGRPAFGWAAGLALLFGLGFLAKLSSYALVPVAAMVAPVLAGRGARWRAFWLVLAAAAAGFGLAILLDPGMQAHPLATLWDRALWRIERVSIQQVIFVGDWLRTISARIVYVLYELFFVGWVRPVVFCCTMVGLITALSRRDRWALATLLLFGWGMALTVGLTPFRWIRYTAAFLPLLLLPAGMGVAALVGALRAWSGWTPVARRRRIAVVGLSLVLLLFAIGWRGEAARFVRPLPTPDEVIRAKALAKALAEPGQYPELHRYFEAYFQERGLEREAAFHRSKRGD